jgi:hypothetical protein
VLSHRCSRHFYQRISRPCNHYLTLGTEMFAFYCSEFLD